MKGKGTAVGAALLALCAWAGPQQQEATTPFYVAPTMQELVSGEVPSGATMAADLIAARGEREAFFVVLRGKAATGKKLRVKWDPLSADDATIESSRIHVFRALWVDADGRRVPDALVPIEASANDVVGVAPEKGEDVPLYVEVAVPRGATPGNYRGSLTVDTAAGELHVPIALRVLKAQLPVRASLPTAFDFSSREASFGSGAKLDANGLVALVREFATAALADRVTLTGGTGDAPAFHSMPGENALQLDFGAFDSEMAALMDGVDTLDGAAQTAITLRLPQGLKGIDRVKYVLAFQKHLDEKGWGDRLIAFEDHPALAGDLVPESLLARRVEECAFADCAAGKLGGKRWWSLKSGGEGISLGLGAKAAQVRAIGWLAFAGGAEGLRYGDAVAGFDDAMWNGATPQGALFYPVKDRDAAKPTVVESLRMKLLRDGLEDYELLKLARESGHAGLTGEWMTKIAASPGAVSDDPAVWRQAREALADAADNPLVAEKPKGKRRGGSKVRERDVLPVPTDRACIQNSDGTTTGCPKE